MSDETEPTQREQQAGQIALAGADIKGVIERQRTGKNGYVVGEDGDNLILKNSTAIAAVSQGARTVRSALDKFVDSLEGLDAQQAQQIEAAAIELAGLCSSVGGEVSRDIEKANRSLNSRDADIEDDMALVQAVTDAPGKTQNDRLAHVMEQRGEDLTGFDTFKRTYQRIKKRLKIS